MSLQQSWQRKHGSDCEANLCSHWTDQRSLWKHVLFTEHGLPNLQQSEISHDTITTFQMNFPAVFIAFHTNYANV